MMILQFHKKRCQNIILDDIYSSIKVININDIYTTSTNIKRLSSPDFSENLSRLTQYWFPPVRKSVSLGVKN